MAISAGVAAVAAGGASIASAGFGLAASSEKAKGVKLQAQGVQAGDEFQAAELDRAAKYGDLKAEQVGAQRTQQLNRTLGNIDAIRAASHADPTSPTGAAYRDYQEEIGGTQKSIEVSNILAQSRKQEAEAAYLRVAGANALLSGDVGAHAQLLGGYADAAGKVSQGLASPGFGFGKSGGSGLSAASLSTLNATDPGNI